MFSASRGLCRSICRQVVAGPCQDCSCIPGIPWLENLRAASDPWAAFNGWKTCGQRLDPAAASWWSTSRLYSPPAVLGSRRACGTAPAEQEEKQSEGPETSAAVALTHMSQGQTGARWHAKQIKTQDPSRMLKKGRVNQAAHARPCVCHAAQSMLRPKGCPLTLAL